MVTLLTKAEIQSLNIDTVERHLIFGALFLRASTVGTTNINTTALDISLNVVPTGTIDGILAVEIYLPYDAYKYNNTAGKLLDAVGELSNNSPTLPTDLSLGTFATPTPPTIPDYDPVIVNTFEKYIAFYAQCLLASVSDRSDSTIQFSFLESQTQPQVLISLNIPINLAQWALTSNYLNSLGTAATSYIAPIYGKLEAPPPVQENDYYAYDYYPSAYTEEVFFTIPENGVLMRIQIDTNVEDIGYIMNADFTLDGTTIYPESYIDYGSGSFEVEFSNEQVAVMVTIDEELAITLYDEPDPDYMDFTITIYPFTPPQ